jgi:RNA polymerase sigma-70 factor (ECF subfamily)
MADLRSMDDASLLAAEEHVGEAFRVFFERHRDAIRGYFMRRAVPPQEAADLIQDVFLAAFTSRRTYRASKGSPRQWLFGIAGNKYADRARQHAQDERMIRTLEHQRIPLTDADRLEFADAVAEEPALQALARLPEDQRNALRARYIEEQDYESIAEREGISQSAARKRTSRARQIMRRLLRGDEE